MAMTEQDYEIGKQYAMRAANARTIYPPGWQGDCSDAPLKFKLYNGVTRYPLSADVDCSLGESLPLCGREYELPNEQVEPYVDLSRLLFYTYGLFCSRFLGSRKPDEPPQWPASDPNPKRRANLFPRYLTRPVPSGGALYPVELYLYLKEGWGIP